MDLRRGESNNPNERPIFKVDADELVDRPASQTNRPFTPASNRKPSEHRRRKNLGWGAGCSLFLLGIVLGALGLLGTVILLFSTGKTDQPLVAPLDPPGTPDIAAQLSQDYLNTEIARNIKSDPVKILNLADLKNLILDVRNNQEVFVTARINTAIGTYDIGITEQISVQAGLVVVRSTGQPHVGNSTIPLNLNDFVNAINTLEVQPQINKYVTGIKADGRTLILVGLQTSPGIITAKFNAQ